jgi:hypothetical protein
MARRARGGGSHAAIDDDVGPPQEALGGRVGIRERACIGAILPFFAIFASEKHDYGARFILNLGQRQRSQRPPRP